MIMVYYVFILFFGLVAADSSKVGIINGTDVDITEHPWMISVYSKKYGYVCSGSLISQDWAITAAHCDGDLEKIRVGSSRLTDDKGTFVDIAESIVHPNFSSPSLVNDLALLRLKFSVNGTNTAPIALPELNAPVPEGYFVNITGWGGTTRDDNHYDKLQGASVVIITIESCIKTFALVNRTVDKEKELCAGRIGDITGGCHGDSGGPAELNGTLIGVTSWEYGGCTAYRKPTVFVNVAYYRDWIQNVTGI